jgi:hypothetical protein
VTPTVTLIIALPEKAEGSTYRGQVTIGIKSSVFEPSEANMALVELYKVVRAHALRECRPPKSCCGCTLTAAANTTSRSRRSWAH